jgi:hypothetical protein
MIGGTQDPYTAARDLDEASARLTRAEATAGRTTPDETKSSD